MVLCPCPTALDPPFSFFWSFIRMLGKNLACNFLIMMAVFEKVVTTELQAPLVYHMHWDRLRLDFHQSGPNMKLGSVKISLLTEQRPIDIRTLSGPQHTQCLSLRALGFQFLTIGLGLQGLPRPASSRRKEKEIVFLFGNHHCFDSREQII